jgi:Flp pilus assembly protein TadG
MTNAIRKLQRSESGASLVEFAILAPVLVFLLIGLVDIGRYAYYAILAANAAHAGAQYGSQDLTYINQTGNIATAVSNDAPGITWTTTSNCLVSTNGGTPVVGCPTGGTTVQAGTIYYVQVSTTAVFTPLIHYPGIPTNVHVTGSSTMRVASQ